MAAVKPRSRSSDHRFRLLLQHHLSLEGEARLESYERLHWAAGEVDEGLFRKVLLGISCRDYEAAVEAVPGGDRAVEVDGVAGVQEGDRQAAEGVSGT